MNRRITTSKPVSDTTSHSFYDWLWLSRYVTQTVRQKISMACTALKVYNGSWWFTAVAEFSHYSSNLCKTNNSNVNTGGRCTIASTHDTIQ